MKSLLGTLFALSLVLSGARISGQQPTRLTGPSGEGRHIPPSFTLPDLDGKVVKSTDLKSRVFILDFWATWCVPCIAEIPMFNRLHENYARRGLRLVGVAVQSGWVKDVKPHVTRHKMKYTVLIGNDETVEDFNVIAFPTTYVVSQDWKVYKKYIGATPGKEAKLQQDLESLLAHP